MNNNDANNPDLILELLWEIDGANKADVPALEDKAIETIKHATAEQLNSYFPDSAQVPLVAAFQYDSIRIFKALLAAGADKKYYDEENECSLADIVSGKPDFAKALKSSRVAAKKTIAPAFNFAGKNIFFSGRFMGIDAEKSKQQVIEKRAEPSMTR